jgi:hypothetical protein
VTPAVQSPSPRFSRPCSALSARRPPPSRPLSASPTGSSPRPLLEVLKWKTENTTPSSPLLVPSPRRRAAMHCRAAAARRGAPSCPPPSSPPTSLRRLWPPTAASGPTLPPNPYPPVNRPTAPFPHPACRRSGNLSCGFDRGAASPGGRQLRVRVPRSQKMRTRTPRAPGRPSRGISRARGRAERALVPSRQYARTSMVWVALRVRASAPLGRRRCTSCEDLRPHSKISAGPSTASMM